MTLYFHVIPFLKITSIFYKVDVTLIKTLKDRSKVSHKKNNSDWVIVDLTGPERLKRNSR